MNKLTSFFMVTSVFLLGIVLGFLLTPIRAGMHIEIGNQKDGQSQPLMSDEV